VDPIALLRGAPHGELARAFIEYVLSPDGQKLWNAKPGTSGGTERFALRNSFRAANDFFPSCVRIPALKQNSATHAHFRAFGDESGTRWLGEGSGEGLAV